MATATISPQVDAGELKRWLEQGLARLVDVREADEFRRERIEGAELSPLSTLDAEKLADPAGRRIVLACASGARSSRAAAAVLAAGGPEVWQLKGGLQAWRQAGLPVVRDRKAPLPLMRQVQIVAGSLILLGYLLGLLVAPGFHLLSGFVGVGLIFAGISGRCGMASLLAKLPYNRPAAPPAATASCCAGKVSCA